MRIAGVISLFLAASPILACAPKEPEPLVPAAGTVQAVDRAADDLADARCDREQRCMEIGPEKKYSNRDHCLSVMRKEARESLGECHRGVDEGDVRQCLATIKDEDCGASLGSLSELKQCGMDDMCE
jgi:hypothetical protein